jgi:hypothetical protein
MNLDEFVDIVIAGNEPTSTTLLRAKVMLDRLHEPTILAWIDREMTGYGPDDPLPPYRILPSIVKANLVAPGWQANGQPLPLAHLTPEQRKHLDHCEVRDGLPFVEQLVKNIVVGHGTLSQPIPMEYNSVLEEGLKSGWHVNSAWCETNAAGMSAIQTQVHSRLLEFLLTLQDKVGAGTENADLLAKVSGIDVREVFRGAVFGQGTVINFGSNNTVSVQNNLIATPEALFAKLSDAGLSQQDIDHLKIALERDSADGAYLRSKVRPGDGIRGF